MTELQSQPSAKIVVIESKNLSTGETKTIRVDKKRLVIGSATSSDVLFSGETISPVHAILEMTGIDGKPVIYDLASESGVLVNGTPQVQAALSSSDKVKIGDHEFTVEYKEYRAEKTSPVIVKESLGGQRLFVTDKKEDLAPLILEDESAALEIFDRRTEAKDSLQVVMFYRNTILDVEHFVDKKKIVIGSGKKDDFCMPPFIGEKFDLVTLENGEYTLHLHSSMKGVISLAGKMTPVVDLIKTSKNIPITSKDFAKISINDVSFFMNHTPAPPRILKPRITQTDPLMAKLWLISLAMTCLTIFGIRSIQVNPQIEIEQLPERVATIIYEPKFMPVVKPPQSNVETAQVKPKEDQKPKVIKVEPVTKPKEPAPKNPMIGEKKPDERQSPQTTGPKTAKPTVAQKASGQEGAGAKAKGTEGTRGKQNAKPADTHQTKAQRPGEGKPNDAASNGKGNSQTNDLGLVDVFKSGEGTLSKVMAGGKGVSNAANKLEGYSGFSTQGAGGLGAAGSDKGGGGESQGLGGLADKGPGGGKKGTGLGALGSGGNLLGGKGKITIDSGGGAGEPIVLGAIDTDAIAREIAKHKDEIKYCYEKEINAENPNLSGRVGVRFVIGSSGSVSSAGISSSTLKNTNSEKCIVDVIKRIQFPPVRGGGIAEVTYPFVFKPSNK